MVQKRKAGKKRVLLAFFLAVILTGLLSPFYGNMLKGFAGSRMNNRAEVYAGHNENALQKVLDAHINSYWKEFSASVKAEQDGEIIIRLTAPDKKPTVLADYKNFTVDGKSIFTDIGRYGSHQPYTYRQQVKAGEKIDISVQIRKYHFDFATLRKTYHFDGSIFFSVCLLSFLLSYRFVQYMSGFKLTGHGSRIDIVFVVIFGLFLFLPMSHISYADKAEGENRLLAPYRPLINDNGINMRYGQDFEQWFNDRFFGRKMLINLYSKMMVHFNKYGKNSKAGIYKDDWLLNTGELGAKTTSAELEKISRGVHAYLDFCNRHKIKCYIEIVPRKLEFIKDKTFRHIPETEKDKAALITAYIKKKLNYDIIYPIKELQQANRQDLVFFKTDHHWTEWGAYAGYQALMQRLQPDFPRLKTVTEKDYEIFYDKKAKGDYDRILNEGSTCMLLRLKGKSCPLKTDYRYYKHKREDKLQLSRNDLLAYKDFEFPFAANKQKMMIIGNSFMENFATFSPYTFHRVFNRRCNNAEGDNLKLSRWQDEILRLKTDIVVILVSSEYSAHLQDLVD